MNYLGKILDTLDGHHVIIQGSTKWPLSASKAKLSRFFQSTKPPSCKKAIRSNIKDHHKILSKKHLNSTLDERDQ
jgi:hypothetical protein